MPFYMYLNLSNSCRYISVLTKVVDQQTDRPTLASLCDGAFLKRHKLSYSEAQWKREERLRGREREREDSYWWLRAAINAAKKQSKETHKHPGVYVDKETAQVATLSEISTWLASTGGLLSDANDCYRGEQGGWYWCAGATEVAVPDSPSNALFSNKLTLKRQKV